MNMAWRRVVQRVLNTTSNEDKAMHVTQIVAAYCDVDEDDTDTLVRKLHRAVVAQCKRAYPAHILPAAWGHCWSARPAKTFTIVGVGPHQRARLRLFVCAPFTAAARRAPHVHAHDQDQGDIRQQYVAGDVELLPDASHWLTLRDSLRVTLVPDEYRFGLGFILQNAPLAQVTHSIKVKQVTGPAASAGALLAGVGDIIIQTLCFPAARQSDCATLRDQILTGCTS